MTLVSLDIDYNHPFLPRLRAAFLAIVRVGHNFPYTGSFVTFSVVVPGLYILPLVVFLLFTQTNLVYSSTQETS